MNLSPVPPPDNTGKTYRTLKKHNAKADNFKLFFLDPKSTTFMNVRGSAMRAGYSELYADNITVQRPKWWVELQESAEFTRASMLKGAERNLNNTINSDPRTETEQKLQHDASKFISERLGKEFYSARQEVTGADGRRLFAGESRQSQKMPLTSLFKGVGTVEKEE